MPTNGGAAGLTTKALMDGDRASIESLRARVMRQEKMDPETQELPQPAAASNEPSYAKLKEAEMHLSAEVAKMEAVRQEALHEIEVQLEKGNMSVEEATRQRDGLNNLRQRQQIMLIKHRRHMLDKKKREDKEPQVQELSRRDTDFLLLQLAERQVAPGSEH